MTRWRVSARGDSGSLPRSTEVRVVGTHLDDEECPDNGEWRVARFNPPFTFPVGVLRRPSRHFFRGFLAAASVL